MSRPRVLKGARVLQIDQQLKNCLDAQSDHCCDVIFLLYEMAQVLAHSLIAEL